MAGEAKLGLSRARHLLVIGDGANGIEELAGHARWKATDQLDWWHLTKAFRRTFPDHADLVAQLNQGLKTGDGDQVMRVIGLAAVLGVGDPDKVAALPTYVRNNRAGFYGARQRREQLSGTAKLAAVEGSRAIEKQIDLVLCYS